MKTQATPSELCDRDAALPLWMVWVASLGFLAVAGVYVFCIIFDHFWLYDDQGYLMVCVQGYLEGNPLFDRIGTCYGPVYFFYEWLVHGLVGIPLTHDATDLLSVAHWLSASIILAVAGWRLTRSIPIAFFIFAQSVVHLESMAGEPGHPQELVVLLLALAALVAAQGVTRRGVLPVLGGIGACLVFTKINVGGFFVIALLSLFLCERPLFHSRRVSFLLMASLISFVPIFLMRQHLAEAWARHYCWQACAGIMAVGTVAHAYSRRSEIRMADWLGAGMSFAGLSGLFLAILLANGSSCSAIVYSLIKVPANLAGVFCIPLHVEHCSWSAAGALAAAVLVSLFRGRINRRFVIIAVAKGAYGVIGGLLMVQDPLGQLGYLLPWAWLLLLPISEDAATGGGYGNFRSALSLIAVWQGLQAYPVGCTQAAIGTFLAVLVYSVCAYDAGRALVPIICAQWGLLRFRSRRTALISHGAFFVVLFLVFVFKWTRPFERWSYYAAVTPLDLRGARLVRPDPRQANTLRMLTKYVQTECDTFLSLPGLNSLYFWAGKRPLTYLSLNGEGIMPNDNQQDEIAAALRRVKRPLIVERETRRAPSMPAGGNRKGPLALIMCNEYREVARLADFRILARKPEFEHQSASSD